MTDKKGKTWEKLVNTPTYKSLLRSPSIVGAVKCEVVVEKVAKTKVTIFEGPYTEPPKTEAPFEPIEDLYGQKEYDNDSALAKKMVKDQDDRDKEYLKDLLIRMIEYKPTPYWKGKLNKLK